MIVPLCRLRWGLAPSRLLRYRASHREASQRVHLAGREHSATRISESDTDQSSIANVLLAKVANRTKLARIMPVPQAPAIHGHHSDRHAGDADGHLPNNRCDRHAEQPRGHNLIRACDLGSVFQKCRWQDFRCLPQ